MSEKNETKKKRGRCVPSRFKEAAEKCAVDASERISSEATKLLLSKQPSLLSSTINETLASSGSNQGCTSTPAVGCTGRPMLDASAISNASCFLSARPKKPNLSTLAPPSLNCTNLKGNSNLFAVQRSQSSLNVKKISQKKTPSTSTFQRPKTTSSCSIKGNNLDDEMEIAYAEYQLALLLQNRAREGLLNKSKDALEKIHKVFCCIHGLLSKNESLKKGVDLVSFVIDLEEHLKNQKNMLETFFKIMPSMEKQYEEIATAIDCVRHKLQVTDVILPEGSEEQLIELLHITDNLLKNILCSAGNVDDVVHTAASASTFVEKGQEIANEINRGSELLTESRNLLLAETSLKFALMDLEDGEHQTQ